MLYLLGVLLAATGLALSIGLHEVGHMVPGKLFGVRVPEFMIGFGPKLWSTRRGETEYGVKAIPVGGYVRLIGMYPPPHGVPAGVAAHPPGRLEQLAEDARVAAWKEVGPGDEHRVFYKLSAPKKIIVMMSGTGMNLVIAFAMFALLLVGIGLPGPSTTVASVSSCIPSYLASEQAAAAAWADPDSIPDEPCGPDSLPAPAAVAGLAAGDRITSVDGAPVEQWSDLTEVTRSSPGQTVVLGVSSDSGGRSVAVTLATVYRPDVDADGMPTDEIVTTGYMGVAPGVEYVSQPWSAVPATMWDVTYRTGQLLIILPVRVYDLARDLIAGRDRDVESPLSVIGVGRISGEVTAADSSFISKIAILVSLMASLNLFLFLFNLLPLLPLDGGHAAGAMWEGLRRRVALARGRPDPGPVDTSKALPVAYVVAIVMIAMSLVVMVADVVNPIRLYG